MAAHRLQVGDTAVDLLLDGIFEAPWNLLIHNGGEAALASALARWGDRPLRIDVNCFLLRGPRGIELVDAGAGPSHGEAMGHAMATLGALGVAPGEVDRIYLTHLHFDHALGLLDGEDARFPRAEVLVPALDLAFHTDPAERARLPAVRHGAFDIAAALIRAYGPRLRAVPFGEAAPGLELLPLPGHTPGQGGVLLRGGGSALMLLGDALHLEDEQAADPDFGTLFDLDPALAVRTRRAVLARAADEGWTIGGGHIGGFGRVRREGSGFRIDPVP